MSRATKNARAVRAQQGAAQLSAASRVATVRGLFKRAAELQQLAALEYDFARRLMGNTP